MPLDNEQLTEVRRLLELRRQTLLEEAGEKPPEPATKGKKKSTKKKAAAKPARRKKNPIEAALANELAEVDEALKRLEVQQERFGYCEHCFMEIPWGELVAKPARRFCSRCR
jgi:RNA polymerase-binding transcription factor DksA